MLGTVFVMETRTDIRHLAGVAFSDGTPRYHGLRTAQGIEVIDITPFRYDPGHAPGVHLAELVPAA